MGQMGSSANKGKEGCATTLKKIMRMAYQEKLPVLSILFMSS
jgi:hypothetical protein